MIIGPNKNDDDYLFSPGVVGVVYDGDILPSSGWVKLAYPERPFAVEPKPFMIWDQPQRTTPIGYAFIQQQAGYGVHTSPVPDIDAGVGFILGVVLIAVWINRKMN